MFTLYRSISIIVIMLLVTLTPSMILANNSNTKQNIKKVLDNLHVHTIRIKAPTISDKDIIGTFMQQDSNIVTIKTVNDTVYVPISSINTMYISRSLKSRSRTGMKFGMIAGGILGTAIGATTNNDMGINMLVLGFGGIAVGSGIGAIIGSAVKTDKWESFPIDRYNFTDKNQKQNGITISYAFKF